MLNFAMIFFKDIAASPGKYSISEESASFLKNSAHSREKLSILEEFCPFQKEYSLFMSDISDFRRTCSLTGNSVKSAVNCCKLPWKSIKCGRFAQWKSFIVCFRNCLSGSFFISAVSLLQIYKI